MWARKREVSVRTSKVVRARRADRKWEKVDASMTRATRGHLLTHMPLAPDSSYTHIMKAVRSAYEVSSQMDEPDPELDLDGLEEPKWGHHSMRRAADKKARDSAEEVGLEKGEIDDLFGWKQRERRKDMQLHYAGPDESAKLARATMLW